MKRNPWLLVPNILGYLRIALLIAFFFVPSPLLKAIFITTSLLLDILDGKIARWLNQCSLFGSRLDLWIDMATLASLSLYVAFLTPNPWLKSLFIFGAINDTISYLLSLTVFYGKKRHTSTNHKTELQQSGFLLPLYYSSFGLGLFNILHDAFLIAQLYPPLLITPWLIYLFFAGYLFRQLSNIEQSLRLLKLFF